MFKRGDVYWTCMRIDGRKIQRSLDTSNNKLAKQIEAKIRADLAESKHLDVLPGQKKSMADLMQKLIDDHGPSVSAAQRRSYENSCKHLEKYFSNTPIAEIRPKEVAAFKLFRLSQRAKPATLNRELACLSKAFSFYMNPLIY